MKVQVNVKMNEVEYKDFRTWKLLKTLKEQRPGSFNKKWVTIAILEDGATISKHLSFEQAKIVFQKFPIAFTIKDAEKISKFIDSQNKKWS